MTGGGGPAGSTSDNPGDPGTLLFDSDRIRVWELVMRPGEACNWHIHDYDHLLVVFEGALILGEKADGRSVELQIPDGQVLFLPRSPVPEIARNASPDRTLRELIIDLKDPAAGLAEAAKFGFFQPGTPTTAGPPAVRSGPAEGVRP